ncbi:MAG: 50S ribosomal protein L5 [Fimbriimonadales bacterium]
MAKTKEKEKTAKVAVPKSRLREHYRDTVLPALVKEFDYTTPMQAPRVTKIVVNMGVGDSTKDAKQLDNSVRDLKIITGQSPVITTAKKAISNFRLRQGMKIGAKVTLRGDRMYHFLDKLMTVVFPRLRDFQGLNPKSFDGRGNFAVGLKEQLVFPEISYDTFDRIRGMDIVVCTTATNDAEARSLLRKMGMPIREK